MAHKVTSGPASEPVSLAEAKAHLRVESGVTADDSYITNLITAARIEVENYCNRALITQTIEEVYDGFPITSPVRYNNRLYLSINPVQSVTSVTYKDESGTQTWGPGDYATELVSEPAQITPVYGGTWPVTVEIPAAVKVTYEAGFGDDADNVPEAIKQSMLLMISQWYQYRDNKQQSPFKMQEGPAQYLLRPYRVFVF